VDLHEFGDWYHRIDLGDGLVTPGDRNQSRVFSLYADLLPRDLSGCSVLDLGANACGLSIEFAKRGASVVAVEKNPAYVRQGRFIIDHFGLNDLIEIKEDDAFNVSKLGRFDIVCCVGLIYHVRHMQLLLDMLSHVAKDYLLISSQTRAGDGWAMYNRGEDRNVVSGWEPTESLLSAMIKTAGFNAVELISTKPHPGETPGNICGNRSYYMARYSHTVPLPSIP